MTPLYTRYAHWMRELRRIARRPIGRTCRTWAAYRAGMTPTMYAADVLKL